MMDEILLNAPSNMKEAIMRLALDSYNQGSMDMLDTLYETGILTPEAYGALLGTIIESKVSINVNPN